jgi:hypothetical protein
MVAKAKLPKPTAKKVEVAGMAKPKAKAKGKMPAGLAAYMSKKNSKKA